MKRKSIDSKEEKEGKEVKESINKRKESQKNVAISRASHFARADKQTSNSSTPTGVYENKNTPKKESWPGPFSVAHEMIANREEAKRIREQQLLDKSNENENIGDDYDKIEKDMTINQLESLYNTNIVNNNEKTNQVPTLSRLCAEVLAIHFDHVEATGELSVETKTDIAMYLSKLRKLTSTNFLLLINGTREVNPDNFIGIPGISCLILPDCSSIDEETMIKGICNANGLYDKNLTTSTPTPLPSNNKDFLPSLKILNLKNCGHSFTAWTTTRLNYYQVLSQLEFLTIGGLYRITDQSLSEFFLTLHNSQTLSHNSTKNKNLLKLLDVSYSSSFKTLSLQSVLNTSPHLTTLILDYTQIDRSSLLLLCSKQYDIPHLNELSLNGICSLTDSILAYLLSADYLHMLNDPSYFEGDDIPICPSPTSSIMRPLGQRLHLLGLKECNSLTNDSLISIRSFCFNLKSLNLSSIISFDSPVSLLGLFISQNSLTSSQLSPSSVTYTPSSLTIPYSIGSNLQHISLSGLSSSVTDDIIIEICKLATSTSSQYSNYGLVSLDISSCSQLTNRSIVALKHHCSHSLRSIDISFIRNISIDILFLLVYSCDNLEKLVLWGCTQFRNTESKFHKKIDNKNLMSLIESKVGLEVIG